MAHKFDEDENQPPSTSRHEMKLPNIDFSESHKRARFNFERICQKYEKVEESGIEIDLHRDIVYAPMDMNLPQYKKNIDKFANFAMKYGSSSTGAAVGNSLESYDNDQGQYAHSLRLNRLFRNGIASPMVNRWKHRKRSRILPQSIKTVKMKVKPAVKMEYNSDTDSGGTCVNEHPEAECKSENVYASEEEEWSNHTNIDTPDGDISFERYLSPTNCSVKSGYIGHDAGILNTSKIDKTIPPDSIEQNQWDTNCSVKSGCLNQNEVGIVSIDEDVENGTINVHSYETNCSVRSGCIEPGPKKAKLITSRGGSVASGCRESGRPSTNQSGLVCKDVSDDSLHSSVLFETDSSDFWNQPMYVLLVSYPSNVTAVFGCERQLCEVLSEDPKRTLLETWIETIAPYSSGGVDYALKESRQQLMHIKRQTQLEKDGYKCF